MGGRKAISSSTCRGRDAYLRSSVISVQSVKVQVYSGSSECPKK